MKAAYRVKQEGLNNNLIDLIIEDPAFKMSKEEIHIYNGPEKLCWKSTRTSGRVRDETLEAAIKEYKELIGNIK